MHAALLFVLCAAFAAEGAGPPRPPAVPSDIGNWHLAGPVESYDAKTIFDYMDGAAEPYLDYAFRRLHVAFYASRDQRVVVEMYDMTRPAEAFGIFSNWLDGEDAKVGQRSRLLPGRLCFWQGHYYTRAYRVRGSDTPREQLAELARQMARALGPDGGLPGLAAALPEDALKPEDVRYLHTMDTLNSIYYVSTANVLDLSEKTEAVMADCTFDGEKVKMLVIAYPDAPARDRAWTTFCRGLLRKEPPGDGIATDELEPGKYAGVGRIGGGEGGAFIAICFEATTPDRCKHALAAVRPPGARHAEAP